MENGYNGAYTGPQIDEAIGRVISQGDMWSSGGVRFVKCQLQSDLWSSKEQTVQIDNILADETKQAISFIVLDGFYEDLYNYRIGIARRSANALTFRYYNGQPYRNIELYVMIQNIGTLESQIPSVGTSYLILTSGAWVVPISGNYKIELHGGGGGGGSGLWDGSANGGGGGGGSGEQFTLTLTKGQSYDITIGKGGAGGAYSTGNGKNGGTSSFGSRSVAGGKGGLAYTSGSTPGSGSGSLGQNGGSGGWNQGGTGGSGGGELGTQYGQGGGGGLGAYAGHAGADGACKITYLG